MGEQNDAGDDQVLLAGQVDRLGVRESGNLNDDCRADEPEHEKQPWVEEPVHQHRPGGHVEPEYDGDQEKVFSSHVVQGMAIEVSIYKFFLDLLSGSACHQGLSADEIPNRASIESRSRLNALGLSH